MTRAPGKEEDPRPREPEEPGRKKRSKPRSYIHADYEWDADTWQRIRDEGYLPPNIQRHVVLIGAYLVGMQRKHKRKTAIAATEFGGQLGRNAADCLAYFDAIADGDEIAGMQAALKYIEWYVTQEEVDFLTEKGRPLNLVFARYGYRDAYAITDGRAAKRGRSASRKGSLAASDSKWIPRGTDLSKMTGGIVF